jgi:hypothetical protein
VVNLINKGEHLTYEGFLKIINIKASSNLGLPDRLKDKFLDVVPVVRPKVSSQTIKDPYWLSGFVDGEAYFGILTQESKTKIGLSVFLRFKITQHVREDVLMQYLVEYLGCGSIGYTSNCANFVV